MCVGKCDSIGRPSDKNFLFKFLANLLAHKYTATTFIFRRPTSLAHHLEDVHDRVINVSVLLTFVELHPHNNDHVACDRETPCSILQNYISNEFLQSKKA